MTFADGFIIGILYSWSVCLIVYVVGLFVGEGDDYENYSLD
jgi:hypothetical protein